METAAKEPFPNQFAKGFAVFKITRPACKLDIKLTLEKAQDSDVTGLTGDGTLPP